MGAGVESEQRKITCRRRSLIGEGRLSIIRLPVRVVEDDSVCSGQVDAEASGARAEEEEELGAALFVELVDLRLTILAGRRAVQPTILPPPEPGRIGKLCELSM